MEHIQFDARDEWESWYAQTGPTSGPMPTAYGSVPGYEFSGPQPGTRPQPWPAARQDYQYYARQDYQDYSDEAAGAWGPPPPPAGYSGRHSTGYPAGWNDGYNDGGYGSDPYGSDPYVTGAYGAGPYSSGSRDTGSYPAGPYASGPYGTGGRFDDTRREVMVADAPSPWREQVARSQRDDSVSAAARVLAAADQQAAAITQQASYQASMVTQQVAYEAAETRDAAKREADQIMQWAAVQASAVREAAEMEAAEMRKAVAMMQGELTDLATRITNTFPNPVLPRTPQTDRPAATAAPAASPAAVPSTQPQARPHAAPAEWPATRPAAPPATRPAARPTGKPGARSAAKPAAGQGRQGAAMRFAVIATSALFLVAAVAGVTEIKLHGFSFFVFRSTGTGESGPGALQEDQGPGQPDAPKPTPSHSAARPILRPSVTVHNG
jgi:hypothetical protein